MTSTLNPPSASAAAVTAASSPCIWPLLLPKDSDARWREIPCAIFPPCWPPQTFLIGATLRRWVWWDSSQWSLRSKSRGCLPCHRSAESSLFARIYFCSLAPRTSACRPRRFFFTSQITHHTSHITHHTSHITHHTSHITHHTSHIVSPQGISFHAYMRRLGKPSSLIVLPDCQHSLTDKVGAAAAAARFMCWWHVTILVQVSQEAHQWIKAALCMLFPDA
jgi:hypothetical protein